MRRFLGCAVLPDTWQGCGKLGLSGFGRLALLSATCAPDFQNPAKRPSLRGETAEPPESFRWWTRAPAQCFEPVGLAWIPKIARCFLGANHELTARIFSLFSAQVGRRREHRPSTEVAFSVMRRAARREAAGSSQPSCWTTVARLAALAASDSASISCHRTAARLAPMLWRARRC